MDPYNRNSYPSPYRPQWPPSSFINPTRSPSTVFNNSNVSGGGLTYSTSVLGSVPSNGLYNSSLSGSFSSIGSGSSWFSPRELSSPTCPRRGTRRYDDASDSSGSSGRLTYKLDKAAKPTSTNPFSKVSPINSITCSETSSKLTRRIDTFLKNSEQTMDRVSRRNTTRIGMPDSSPDLSLSRSSLTRRSTSAVSIALKAGKHLKVLNKKGKGGAADCSTSESIDNLDSDSDEGVEYISDDTSADLSKVKLLVTLKPLHV